MKTEPFNFSCNSIVWPHWVLSSSPMAHGDDNSPAAGGSTAGKPALAKKTSRTGLKASFAEGSKINRLNKGITRHETVLCQNMPERMAEDPAIRQKFWETAQESCYLHWFLPTLRPELLGQIFPPDWGRDGYSNVIIALKLDSGTEASRERLSAFQKLPARYRAIWLEPFQSLTTLDDWHKNIQWVIADSTGSPANGLFLDWVRELRETCHLHGVAFYHNASGGAPCPPATNQELALPEHPFPNSLDFDLHRACLLAKENDAMVRKVLPADSDLSTLTEAVSPSDTALQVAEEPAEEEPAEEERVEEERVEEERVEEEWAEEAQAKEEWAEEASGTVAVVVAKHTLAPDAPATVEATVVDEEVLTRSERFEALDSLVHEGIRAPINAGQALLEIRDGELWRDGGYDTWESYCNSFLEVSRSYVNKIIRFAEIIEVLVKLGPPLDSHGDPILPDNECQTRPLAKLRDEKQISKAWRLVVKRSDGNATAAIVATVVSKLMAGKASPKPPNPGRKELRMQLLDQLRQAAMAGQSLEVLLDLIDQIRKAC